MSESNYIALDFGAGSGRAILGTLKDTKLLLKEVHRFKNKIIEKNGHLFWDFQYLLDELIIGLNKIGASKIDSIKGIGIDTWGVDYGLIDKSGKLLNNPFAYRDSRTNGIMDEVFKIISKRKVYEQTGIQFLQFNTLYQLFTAIKFEKLNIEKIDKLLFLPDMFNYYLTGRKVSEYTIASTSQMLNAKTKQWDEKIFQSLTLPKQIMPELVRPGRVIGKLHSGIQSKTGLKAIDVIAVGAHDTASAIAAVPVQSKHWAYLSSGTWSLIGIETEEPIINDKSFEFGFTNEGGVEGTNRFLKNTMGLWILEQSIKKWNESNKNITYQEIFAKAKYAEPFSFLIDPDDPAFLNPPDMLDAIDNYCKRTNQKVPKKQSEYVRCILESLALKYRFIIERINNLVPGPVEVLHIVGGGSQNEMLNQFTADALGVPVVSGPVEATAIGNILFQAVAKGDLSNLTESREVVKNSFKHKEYLPKEKESWEMVYQKAKEIFS